MSPVLLCLRELAEARGAHRALEVLVSDSKLGSFEWECLCARERLARLRISNGEATYTRSLEAAIGRAGPPVLTRVVRALARS